MKIPLRRATITVVSIALGVGSAACSSDSSDSNTAELVVGTGAPSELFVRTEDVMLFPGFDGAEAVDLDAAPSFENPDPRGPCGGPVVVPSFDEASARVLTGTTIGLTQLIAPAGAKYAAYISDLAADLDAECGPYNSATNTGATQTVSEITAFEVTGDGVQGVAWTSLVEVGEQAIYVGITALETAESVTLIRVQSATAIPPEGMDALVQIAVLRLQGPG